MTFVINGLSNKDNCSQQNYHILQNQQLHL